MHPIDGQMISRWTDGEAMLRLLAMRGHVVREIHLAGTMIYAVNAPPEYGTLPPDARHASALALHWYLLLFVSLMNCRDRSST